LREWKLGDWTGMSGPAFDLLGAAVLSAVMILGLALSVTELRRNPESDWALICSILFVIGTIMSLPFLGVAWHFYAETLGGFAK
jgi:hypothetical protein